MNTSSFLQALIKNFNDDNLESFLREKSDSLEFTAEELYYNKEKFINYDNAKLLAKSDLPDGTFIVCTLRVTKDLTERSSKKEQYELAKNILKSSYYDAGIFVFYDHNSNFRFSLIYAEYQGNKRTWNNFKRFTYFVSPHQTNKTFIDQIGNADFSTIEALKKAFSVEPVTKQFYDELQNWYFWAMDQVEFPDDEDKDRKNRNAKNLIRMITRIIFIWFMKEKRLIPATLFDKSYIDTLLNYGDATGSTYYKAILQNLFFATLNTPMRKDDPQSRIFIEDAKKFGFVNDGYLQQGYFRYSRFITDKEAFLKEFDNIPFLNGGLFESLDKKVDGREIRIDCFSDNPKNETRLKVPDYLFFSEEQITDLSAYLENGKRKKVRGLITILNSYNFTVEENTPLDKEIALDPELLGKVFENLLASYNPETAVTARKATGSYYTPREIVDYMVKESLIQYFSVLLGNDENNREKLINLFSYTDNSNPFNNEDDIHKMLIGIEKIKILDPACGSGAFPMSILHSLVLALHKLDPENQKWKNNLLEKVPVELKEEVEKSLKNKSLDYIRKLGLIENCIFGVDIQEIAIQISKLRFFISLLIEQEVDDNKPNRDIRALPNLETKFVAANSLINLEPDPNKANSLIKSPEVEALEEKLFAIREKIFYTNSRNEKLQLEKELTLIREQLKLQLENGSFSNDKADKITSWDPFDQNTHADWFDPEWMFGIKDGFDIVIGNPPYIGEKGHKEIFKNVKNVDLGKFYVGKMDYFYFFFHLALNIAKDNGYIAFITTNYYITALGAKKLREDLYKRATIIKLINFNELKIFESATGQHNMITILKKGKKDNELANTIITHKKGHATSEILQKILSGDDNETDYYQMKQKDLYDDDEYYIRLIPKSDESIQKILDKIKNTGTKLGNICNVNQGIVTGADKVSKKHIEEYNINANINDGIFVLSNSEINTLNLTENEKKILKPWFKNSDILRWITFFNSNDNLLFLSKDLNEKYLQQYYPNIYIHIYKYKNIMISKRKNLNERLDKWFTLNRGTAHPNIFISPKIVAPQRSPKNTFGYNEVPWYASADVYFITQKDENVSLKYILALLNSKLYYLWLYYRGKRKGEFLELYQKPLSEIPIKIVPQMDQQPFIDLVDKILAAKKDNPQADTTAWEKEIDQLVYKLYDLTDEEIAIVESR